MADAPRTCASCVHFDQIVLPKNRKARHGWCDVKSVYPATEQSGQVFPAGVKRAAPDELAKPVVVSVNMVVPNCPHYRAR